MIIPHCVIQNVTTTISPAVPLSATCDNVHHCRSIANIIVSCTSTIYLCTWVAVHPNVPEGSDEAWWKKLILGTWAKEVPRNRILLMMSALFAPEWILAWAFIQWAGSCGDLKRTLDMHPTCTWTEMHAMLARMGGLELVSEDGHKSKQDELSKLPQDILMPSKAQIEDRGKGDYIAKSITLLQTLWFAVQAATRVSQGLDVTLLELTTLGHVLLHVLISWCWWNKPLCVQFPVEVRKKRGAESTEGTAEVEESGQTNSGAPRLPFRVRLGAYRPGKGGRYWKILASICVLCVIGGLFGMIHCLAWNSTFPTSKQQYLWRVSAFSITIHPGIYVILMFIEIFSKRKTGRIGASLLLTYCISRIYLLVVALQTLRDLPYSALEIPSWSIYIPHIG